MSEETSNSQPSPDASIDKGEQVDINGEGVEATIVATMAVITIPTNPANLAEIAAESGKGSEFASEEQAITAGVGNGASGAATKSVQQGSSRQVFIESSQSSNKAVAGQIEELPGAIDSAVTSQVAGTGKQESIAPGSNLSINRIAGGSGTSATSEDGIPAGVPGGAQAGQSIKEAGSRFAGTGGADQNQTNIAGRVDPTKTGDGSPAKLGAGTEISQSPTRLGANMSADNAGQGSPNRGTSFGNAAHGQTTGASNVATERGAATQATDPVIKPSGTQEMGSVSIGAATGVATGRDVSAATASRGAEATLNQKGDILDQILDRAAAMSVPRNTSMRVQLRPPELGWMDLRFGMKDGILTLHITTESASTKGLIEMALPQLRQALQARDIQVGDLSLGLNSGSGNLPGWLGSGTPSFDSHSQWTGLWRRASSATSQVMENPEPADLVGERAENSSSHYLVDYRI